MKTTLVALVAVLTLCGAASTAFAKTPRSIEGELVRAYFESDETEDIKIEHYLRETKTGTYFLLSGSIIEEVEPLPNTSDITVRVIDMRRSKRGVVGIEGELVRAHPPKKSERQGDHRTAFIFFNFQDDTSEPFNEQNVTAWMFADRTGVNEYWKKSSDGEISLHGNNADVGDFYGYYTLPISVDDACRSANIITLAHEAIQEASEDGYSGEDYEHTVFLFPDSPCHYAVATDIYVWLSGDLSYRFWKETLTHELGHNLMLSHAKRFVCEDISGTLVGINTRCDTVEYGDFFNVMANHLDQELINTAERLYIGLDQNIVEDTDTSGPFTLTSVEGSSYASSLPKAIRIPAKRNSEGDIIESIYIEYRNPDRAFENPRDFSPLKPGVIAYAVKHPTDSATKLLNLYPSAGNSGDPYAHIADPSTGIAEIREIGALLEVLSINGDTATVFIDPGEACIAEFSDLAFAPTGPLTTGENATFNVSVENRDLETCGTSAYDLEIYELETGYATTLEFTLDPGESASSSFAMTIPGDLQGESLRFETALIRDPYRIYSDEYYTEALFEFPVTATKALSPNTADATAAPTNSDTTEPTEELATPTAPPEFKPEEPVE